ncbi:hypothetical protein VOLCADRAFT_86135 [Volvox carteri f. nagariensis]|uniref:VTT domain-containing protein n=1 Tax=Volvox carteri f. nagariensis TaxID=3068 RepID=D8THZ0_VOLCA|nr:uncharacterized protein VOLCADRAFT_86135 [Volvox carteri f. nagariensis]EFJ52800.1 hypothetical protein VOLCADRAFT_86135 [Volvox carteri f. nagariensis]|eukprot:XP_002945805.1 hypothetical protein VOLCADRAFT_86135 [Volvox carteri f. nagariensis]
MQGGRLLALLVFAGLSLLSYKYVHSGELAHFVLKIQANPLGSLHVFVLFHISAVVLLFPAMLLQAITGALYGLYAGLVVSWFASAVGQSLAFLLGRYLFRSSVKAYLVQRVPNFPQIEAAIKKEGWKLMCLLRLSPILPYNILNYAAALTPISFFAYSLSSAAAIIPWTCLYVYLGTLSTSVVAELARGKLVPQYRYRRANPGGDGGDSDSDGSRIHMLVSSSIYMALLCVTIVYGYVLSKRAITSVLKSVGDAGPGSGAVGPQGSQDVELSSSGERYVYPTTVYSRDAYNVNQSSKILFSKPILAAPRHATAQSKCRLAGRGSGR